MSREQIEARDLRAIKNLVEEHEGGIWDALHELIVQYEAVHDKTGTEPLAQTENHHFTAVGVAAGSRAK